MEEIDRRVRKYTLLQGRARYKKKHTYFALKYLFSDKLFTFLSELKSNTELEPILVEMLTSLINLRNSNWGHNTNTGRYQFPVWLQNRLISTGLEPVLSHTEKSCIASYYKQFFDVYILK